MTRTIVALNWTRRIPEDIVYAGFIADCLAKDPVFASPPLPLAVLQADILALKAAEAAALRRTAGAAAERNYWLAKVYADLMVMRSYVQRVADENPATAGSIIESSGMHVKKSSGHGKLDFEVKQDAVEGTVHLVARAARTRASYEWQLSTDGVTWISRDATVAAKTTLKGLTRATRYFFRYRTVTKDGPSDWSQVVSLVVQ